MKSRIYIYPVTLYSAVCLNPACPKDNIALGQFMTRQQAEKAGREHDKYIHEIEEDIFGNQYGEIE